MNRILKNKYFAGGLVFAAFQYLAYSTFIGQELTDSSRRRSKGNAIDNVIGWLVERLGQIPTGVLLVALGFALGYFTYRRMERLTQG